MLPQNKPDRIRILFDDDRLVANAGLILPATLALRLGLPQLLRKHLDLGGAPGRGNTGDKMMTLVASALAGGDCIDDADVLRAGGTAGVLGFTAKAPSTLGTFLRSFRWGHVRQLDRVSRELLARVWKAGAGPGTHHSPSTLIRRSARPTDWPRRAPATTATPVRGAITRCWPSPPAPATWCWPACARAGPTPPAALPTSCVKRWGGCATAEPGANSRCGPTAASIPTPWSPSAAGWMSASPSPSASAPACGISSRRYPKMPGRRFLTGWTAPPMWPRPPTPRSRPRRTPRRYGSSSGG